jgi:hypothetical protein
MGLKVGVRFLPKDVQIYSFLYRAEIGSVAHPTSYPIGVGGHLPGVK